MESFVNLPLYRPDHLQSKSRIQPGVKNFIKTNVDRIQLEQQKSTQHMLALQNPTPKKKE